MTRYDALAPTRDSLHRVAEHVLAAVQYASNRRIDLRPHGRGIRTDPFGADGRVVAVELDELVVSVPDGELLRVRPATLGEAASAVGAELDALAAVYPPATPADAAFVLTLDRSAVSVLADWYQLGNAALAELAPDVEPQLWPEHFDLAITVGSVNYGFSPGDEHVGVPYAYVGPHDLSAVRPAHDAFWNAPFGAARTIEEITDLSAAVAFLRDGGARAAAALG